MTGSDRDTVRALEMLSALTDGEVDSMAVERACSAWHQDAAMRERWHAYHLIGDVLRSEELGISAGADESLLRRVRERLADEPAVLAPRPLPALIGSQSPVTGLNGRMATLVRERRRTWGAPIAVAAGFVAMAGLLVAVRQPSPGALDGQQVSLMSLPAATLTASAEPSLAQGLAADMNGGEALTAQNGGATLVVSDNILRDAKLDRYLAAHQEFSGATAFGESSGFMRSITHEIPAH